MAEINMSQVIHLSVSVAVYVFLVFIIQGFLWVRRLRVVLVHRGVHQFQVVQTLPSLLALHEDPVNGAHNSLLTHGRYQ